MEGTVSFKLILVTFTVTLLSAAVNVHGCPSVCLCFVDQSGFRTANCSGVRFIFENKYAKLFNEVEVLNIQIDSDDSRIMMQDDMFIPFSKLKFLNLSKCKINYLPKNVFKGLKKIVEIDLSSNNIKHFDNSVFENLYTLYKLNLRGNPLQVSYKPFITSGSLRELDLGYCGITVLQNEFFHGVKKVTILYLDGNHLQTIKEHVLPRGITHLNLANNRIVNVPVNTISSLNQLLEIDLGANPINCTCSLLNLQDRLSGRGIIIEGDVRCSFPLELQNLRWSEINEIELCNKETFSSRLHTKKLFKYSPYQKKDVYFENEKFNPFESIQGDDPGMSTDEVTDYDLNNQDSNEDYDEPFKSSKSAKKTGDEYIYEKQNDEHETDLLKSDLDIKTEKPGEVSNNGSTEISSSLKTENGELQAENLLDIISNIDKVNEKTKENLNDSAKDDDVEKLNGSITEDKKLEKLSIDDTENSEGTEGDLGHTDVVNSKEEYTSINIAENKDPAHEVIDENDEDSTQNPSTTDDIIDIPIDDIKESSVLIDENMKKDDQVIPVGELPHHEFKEELESAKVNIKTNATDNVENGNVSTNENNNYTNSDESDNNKQIHKHEEETPSNKDNIVETVTLVENVTEYQNSSDVEENFNKKHVHYDGTVKNKEDNSSVLPQNANNSSDHKISIGETTAANELEGSGDDSDEIITGNASIPVVGEDVSENSPSTIFPNSELPVYVNPEGSFEGTEKEDENGNSRQIVDKKQLTYEDVGPYVVVACIIIFIAILISFALYKGLCKSNKTNNRKPAMDVEANNGTELQDMASLLPKTPDNEEKHNNKYPNEAPSPETVNLIKSDKVDDVNESRDLNQNDNKNEPVVKNGKAPEGSPPPIEITKAKITVLSESIPRTPIFVQRSATINNG
ncbi:uncharacterized protein LOC142333781 [Lycorma delicatula]|uniref:uncharacterized protein LOC142333781 n=1 Tax=Lycorma delicatula TaxID=130591 RepID=UPI003F517BDB